jgi:hypothetical protein
MSVSKTEVRGSNPRLRANIHYLCALNRGQGKLNTKYMNSIETKLWGANITVEQHPDGDCIAFTMRSNSTGNAEVCAHISLNDVPEFIAGINEMAYDNRNHLPSRYQIGDKVKCNWFNNLVINEAEVIKVHFTESKVLYDLEVIIHFINEEDERDVTFTRLYNVDSGLLSPFEEK